MIFLHATSPSDVLKVNEYIANDKKVFVLIYMEGCGPCMATRPEWNKIKDELENKHASNSNVVIAEINKDLLGHLTSIGDIIGFPTMKYISNRGKNIEDFENAKINNKQRIAANFVEWIEDKINMKGGKNKNKSTQSSSLQLYNRLTSQPRKYVRKKTIYKKTNKKHKKNKTHKNK